MNRCWIHALQGLLAIVMAAATATAGELEMLRHNDPDLVVDLGVGLWALPLPMDYDGDGDNDLIVATVNKPSPGIYFFENTEGNVDFPIFKPPVRIGDAKANLTIGYHQDGYDVMSPGARYPSFREHQLTRPLGVPFKPSFHTGRANQWKLYDLDGDGRLDLIVGASDWRDYGWDDAYDDEGRWTNGPLHGRVYFMKNIGTGGRDAYAEPVALEAGGHEIDVYGCPSPCLADFDGDGDVDLICGSFLDKLTYFENIGSAGEPQFRPGQPVVCYNADDYVVPFKMELQMLQVIAIDWNKNGLVDLVIGQEDGRVALALNSGEIHETDEAALPIFEAPRFFQQQADLVKCGALATPVSVDWDGDGDEDLICGNTAGYLEWIENLGGSPPRWAAPRRLTAGGETIRIEAGPNGSIQGPAEAKWGYTVSAVADWDHDGLLDIVVNSIWGKIVWYRNIGSPGKPELAPAQPVRTKLADTPPGPAWNWWSPEPGELVTQWRTTPVVIDLNEDGLNDLVMLDHEGYLAFFERVRDDDGELVVLPGKRIFLDEQGEPLRLNDGWAGKSGRRKLVLVDWDGDGRLDILVNSTNADWLRNIGDDGELRFKNMGPVSKQALAGHTTSPTIVDWDQNGIPDLLIGAEDGFFYYLRNPRAEAGGAAR